MGATSRSKVSRIWDLCDSSISVRKVANLRSMRASVCESWVASVGAVLVDSANEALSVVKVERVLDLLLGLS
jgi:hypothetical protein